MLIPDAYLPLPGSTTPGFGSLQRWPVAARLASGPLRPLASGMLRNLLALL